MPVMDGLEAARGRSPSLLPQHAMLMLTMHKFEQLSKEAHAAGIKDVLSKSDGVAGLSDCIAKQNVALNTSTSRGRLFAAKVKCAMLYRDPQKLLGYTY